MHRAKASSAASSWLCQRRDWSDGVSGSERRAWSDRRRRWLPACMAALCGPAAACIVDEHRLMGSEKHAHARRDTAVIVSAFASVSAAPNDSRRGAAQRMPILIAPGLQSASESSWSEGRASSLSAVWARRNQKVIRLRDRQTAHVAICYVKFVSGMQLL